MKNFKTFFLLFTLFFGKNVYAGEYIKVKNEFWGEAIRYSSTKKEIEKNGFSFVFYKLNSKSELYKDFNEEQKSKINDYFYSRIIIPEEIDEDTQVCIKGLNIYCTLVHEDIKDNPYIRTYSFIAPKYVLSSDKIKIRYVNLNGIERIGVFDIKTLDFNKLVEY